MLDLKMQFTFNADGWPARKIAMFSLLAGTPPMNRMTKLRMMAFRAYTSTLCRVLGHRHDTDADREYKVCSRCVTFLQDPDLIPSNIKRKK